MMPYLAMPNRAGYRRHLRAAIAVTFCVALVGLLAVPYGDLPLGVNTGFLPAFGCCTLCVDLITAVLLFSQARSGHDASLARLATAYLVSVFTIVPHLLAFPGVFANAPIIGGSASAVWLWCVWHGGFALAVCWYTAGLRANRPAHDPDALRDNPVRNRRYVFGAALVILAAALLATIGLPLLPTILVDRSYGRLNTLGIGPFVLLCNLTALALVILRLRLRTVMAVWLTVAMSAASVDVALTLFAQGRFTLGWYAARCLSLATGVTVLIALLSELISLYRQISENNRHLERLSLTDGLTEVPNRRAFDAGLATEWRRVAREQQCLSLLMIDIDFFKNFNDLYGHPEGDACLRTVSQAIMRSIRRPGDFMARIGGEEFAVILPNTEENGAMRVAQAINQAVRLLDIPTEAGLTGRVTVSIGVASCRPGRITADSAALMEAADQALYSAKRGGRNCSVAATLSLDEAAARVMQPATP